jgi:EmrB/QacA subfamily drug resistance transporter
MNQKIAVSIVYVAAMFMTIMDSTIVNVALPTIARDFHTNTASVAATVIAFLVSLAIFIPASGWLGDHLGGKRVLLGATAIFTVASVLCGIANSLGELVFFRVLQGVGGGLMSPVGFAMLLRVFPPAERIRAASLVVIPTTLAPALGPVIGGIFVTDFSWRWVFFVNVPIGICAIVFGSLFLVEQRQSTRSSFDIPGFALSGIGLGLLMYGVSEGPTAGWATARILVTAVAGAVLVGVFVVYELRLDHPLLDLRLFHDRLFRSGSAVMTLGATAFTGVLFLLAIFLQDALGFSALRSGLTIFPEALGVMAGAQTISLFVYPRLGPRRIMVTGLSIITSTVLILAFVGTSTNLWLVRAIVFVLGAGMAGVFVPAQAASLATISHRRIGGASTLFNAQFQLGGAVGVAILTTVLTAAKPVRVIAGRHTVHLAAYHLSFVVAAGIAVFGVYAATTIKDSDAASTVVPRHRRNTIRVGVESEVPSSFPDPVTN